MEVGPVGPYACCTRAARWPHMRGALSLGVDPPMARRPGGPIWLGWPHAVLSRSCAPCLVSISFGLPYAPAPYAHRTPVPYLPRPPAPRAARPWAPCGPLYIYRPADSPVRGASRGLYGPMSLLPCRSMLFGSSGAFWESMLFGG